MNMKARLKTKARKLIISISIVREIPSFFPARTNVTAEFQKRESDSWNKCGFVEEMKGKNYKNGQFNV